MKEKLVPSAWLEKDGRRLDSQPYLSGKVEARLALETLSARKDRLDHLTLGGARGIFHAGRESRVYVADSRNGVPFLSSSDILLADFSHTPLISRRQVAATPAFVVRASWTLITRSGTVGRMVYVRPDMDGAACSEHALRVVPDDRVISPGYLFAFLSSKFGVPLVAGSRYGSMQTHIEPSHIRDLPVPRFGAIEREIHHLVENAAQKRARAAQLLHGATEAFYARFRLERPGEPITATALAIFSARASTLRRLDAHHHNPKCVLARDQLAACCPDSKQLGDVARVFTPAIFKRIRVESSDHGFVYYSGSELFELSPDPRGYLSRRSPNIQNYLVEQDWLLIQDAGQLDGLIGRIVRTRPFAHGSVVSNHLMRVVAESREDAAFLFLVLDSDHGYLTVCRHAFGTSIPQLDPTQVATIRLPWPARSVRAELGADVLTAWTLQDEADVVDGQAVAEVERQIHGVP